MARISPLMVAPPLIFGAFVLLAAVGMFRDDPEALPSAREGQPAPPLVLTAFPGAPGFDDATMRDGTVKLVNYWASWCAPCRAEHPSLEKLAGEGIPIYGINYKDTPEKGLAFLAELGDPYAAIGSDGGSMGIDWGVYGVPETYVIGGDGTIHLRFAGPVTAKVMEETILPAIARASGGGN